jgi:hypothetical protein
VIPRAERGDPTPPLLRVQRAQLVGRTADLEGAAALEVLTLEEEATAGDLVEEARRDDRRSVRVPGDPIARGEDVVIGDREGQISNYAVTTPILSNTIS